MVHKIVSYYLAYKISNTLIITVVNTELKKGSASMTNQKKKIYILKSRVY